MLKNYKLNLIFSVILGSSLSLYTMEKKCRVASSAIKIFSSTDRKKIAQDILSTPLDNLNDTELYKISAQFKADNDHTCLWFKNHKKNLQLAIQQTIGDAKVKMMGSRRWNTMHILSDIDAVVVTESEEHEKVIDSLEAYYATNYSAVSQFRTKTRAGLYLFILKDFVDPELGEMKLEYTIQSPATNRMIIDGMTKRLIEKFTDELQKIRYAIAMMEAVYNNDTQGQLKLKEWTRVLS